MPALLDSELILSGKVCPYCGKAPVYEDSKIVYGISYGMIYHSEDCEAWVGVHRGTDKPLGRLANKELRDHKRLAHKYFDPLWQKKMEQGHSKKTARGLAYKWLAGQMEIEIDRCHIGMFDIEECKKVVEICKRFYK